MSVPPTAGKAPIQPSPVVDLDPAPLSGRRAGLRSVRQSILSTLVLFLVALVALLSIPAFRALQTALWIQTRGCTLEWQFDSTNWWYGGTTDVICPRFRGSSLGDDELRILKHLPRVRSVQVAECERITDGGLGALVDLPYVTHLDLSRVNRFRQSAWHENLPPLSDACLVPVEPLKQLEALSLSGNKITDAGLQRISTLTNLRILDLDATEITDAGLVELTKLKSLEVVNLSATRVTPAGALKLQDALPTLTIILDGDEEVEAGVKRSRGEKK
jgi:hypothetical protein